MINRLIQRLKTKGVTQIVVTHDLETAYQVADRIVMISKGRVLFDGTPEELRSSDEPDVREFLDPGSLPSEWRPQPKTDEGMAHGRGSC
jgi:phospholipid/cholesterol/gamma-HCH transport system ATP-binding protein